MLICSSLMIIQSGTVLKINIRTLLGFFSLCRTDLWQSIVQIITEG